jgi:hypothetical protein
MADGESHSKTVVRWWEKRRLAVMTINRRTRTRARLMTNQVTAAASPHVPSSENSEFSFLIYNLEKGVTSVRQNKKLLHDSQ